MMLCGTPSGSHVTRPWFDCATGSARGPNSGFASSKYVCPHAVIGGNASSRITAPPDHTPLMSRRGAGPAGFAGGAGVSMGACAFAGADTHNRRTRQPSRLLARLVMEILLTNVPVIQHLAIGKPDSGETAVRRAVSRRIDIHGARCSRRHAVSVPADGAHRRRAAHFHDPLGHLAGS